MNKTEAFWLPPGSIRAGLAIMLVLAIIAATFVPNIPATALATLGPMAGMAVQAYFTKEKAPEPSNGPEA